MMTKYIASVVPAVIIGSLAGAALPSRAAIICDGIPVGASLSASPSTLSVLSSNPGQLVFKLESPVGNDTHLGLLYSGTAQNGYDVQPLPASVLIAALQSSVKLNVWPKPNYPFPSKTLTITITNSDNVCVMVGSPATAAVTLVGFDPPGLAVPTITSTGIQLTWWAPVPGYVLQSATQLTPGNWVTETNAATGAQGTNTVLLTSKGRSTFYRLVKP